MHWLAWQDLNRMIKNGVLLNCDEDHRVHLPLALNSLITMYNSYVGACAPDLPKAVEPGKDKKYPGKDKELKMIIGQIDEIKEQLALILSRQDDLEVALSNLNLNLNSSIQKVDAIMTTIIPTLITSIEHNREDLQRDLEPHLRFNYNELYNALLRHHHNLLSVYKVMIDETTTKPTGILGEDQVLPQYVKE